MGRVHNLLGAGLAAEPLSGSREGLHKQIHVPSKDAAAKHRGHRGHMGGD